MKLTTKLHVTQYLLLFFIIISILVFSGTTGPASIVYASDADVNQGCIMCHSNPDMRIELPSGESVSLYVDADEFAASVHGQMGHACTDCHREYTGYPHPGMEATNYRDFSLELYPICLDCHQTELHDIEGNVHMVALGNGSSNAAVCTDCHGNHNIQPPGEPRSAIPKTCEKCHSEIFYLYRASVHGSALMGEGNADVPSCTDCHGSHKLLGPNNSPFHLFSPEICRKCHEDPDLMDKYGLRSDTYDTYVSDFHGTSVILFQESVPDQDTNKPACTDCHGVHGILSASNPDSSVMKENLLETCKRCHPNATENFPESWLSHYRPSPEHAPVVFFIKMFYAILIPLIIGGMLVFVVSDYFRQRIDFRRENRDA